MNLQCCGSLITSRPPNPCSPPPRRCTPALSRRPGLSLDRCLLLQTRCMLRRAYVPPPSIPRVPDEHPDTSAHTPPRPLAARPESRGARNQPRISKRVVASSRLRVLTHRLGDPHRSRSPKFLHVRLPWFVSRGCPVCLSLLAPSCAVPWFDWPCCFWLRR